MGAVAVDGEDVVVGDATGFGVDKALAFLPPWGTIFALVNFATADGAVVGSGVVGAVVVGEAALVFTGVLVGVVAGTVIVVVGETPFVCTGVLVGLLGGTVIVVGALVGAGVVGTVVGGGALVFRMAGSRYSVLVTLEGLDVTDGQFEAATSAAPPASGWQAWPAVAVAVFSSLPCWSWASVTVSVAEHVVVCPTASVVMGQATGLSPGSGSFTVSCVKGVFPVLVTAN